MIFSTANRPHSKFKFTPGSNYATIAAVIYSRYSVTNMHVNVDGNKTVTHANLHVITKLYPSSSDDFAISISEDAKSFILEFVAEWNSCIIFGRGLDSYSVVEMEES